MDIIGSLVDLSSLTCVYFALLSVGVLYALVILVTGGMSDFGVDVDVDFGGDLDIGGPDVMAGSVDVTSLSPVTIASFVAAFGAFGLIGQSLFGASGPASLAWASLGGLVVGLVMHLAFIYAFLKPQGSSEVTVRDIVGARAEVITPIPATSVGEIALVAQGARMTMTARASSGQPIGRGVSVRVEEVVGSVARVVPLAPAASEDDSAAKPNEV